MLIVVLSGISLASCNSKYNPVKDDEFMEKLSWVELLFSGQVCNVPLQSSGSMGWYYKPLEQKMLKRTVELHIPNRYQVFGNSRLITAEEISRRMQPITVTLKKDKITVSDNAYDMFTIDGKKFKNFTWKDSIYRNVALEGEALPAEIIKDKAELEEWMKQNCNAPTDFKIDDTATCEIRCRFVNPVTEEQMRRFMFYRDDNMRNAKALVKTGTDSNSILLQDIWGYIPSSLNGQLRYLSSEECKYAVDMVLKSGLFDLPTFNIEEAYQYVLNNPQCYIGLICDVTLPKAAQLFSHMDELGEDNDIEILDIKYIY